MSAIDVALVAARLVIGCWLLWSVRTLPPAPAAAGDRLRTSVSVVVPARDEERSLPNLLASLPVVREVVVVDDGSTDRTAEVAAAAGAAVLPSRPVPEGWIGKSWACAQGAEVTGGDDVVFVDADVRVSPGGLEAVLAALDEHGGLVSVQPFHEPERPVEKLAAIFNIVGFAGTDAATPLGRWRGTRGAFGPVLATGRGAYERVGGHASVGGELLDDLALAGRYRSLGLPVTVFGGADAIRFRMYPEGLGQLVEGFTKNMAGGASSVRRSTVVLVVAWLTLLVQASVAPVRTAITGQASDVLAAAVLYLVVAAQFWWMARRLGRFGVGTALAFPLSVALFLAVFVRSAWATATGAVRWRGRQLSTRRR